MSCVQKGSNEEGKEIKIKSRSDGCKGLGKDSFLHTNESKFALLLIYRYTLHIRVRTRHEYDILTFKPRAFNSWLVNLLSVLASLGGATANNTSQHGEE